MEPKKDGGTKNIKTLSMEELPYYHFEEDSYSLKLEGRYFCANGFSLAIVASITKGIDWAAYIGSDQSRNEEDTLKFVAQRGCKLSKADAQYFFPEIILPYRY